MTAATRYTIFMLLKAEPAWLRLSRNERNTIAEEALGAALTGMSVTHRHFDAEAFSGACSDVAVFETENLTDYYVVIERLCDTVIFSEPYFSVVSIIPALEDGFRHFERGALTHAA